MIICVRVFTTATLEGQLSIQYCRSSESYSGFFSKKWLGIKLLLLCRMVFYCSQFSLFSSLLLLTTCSDCKEKFLSDHSKEWKVLCWNHGGTKSFNKLNEVRNESLNSDYRLPNPALKQRAVILFIKAFSRSSHIKS